MFINENSFLIMKNNKNANVPAVPDVDNVPASNFSIQVSFEKSIFGSITITAKNKMSNASFIRCAVNYYLDQINKGKVIF